MKRIVRWLLLLSAAAVLLAQCKPSEEARPAKYVFYFIGDGMGVNQVNGTEMFLAETEGRIGVTPLNFTGFPVVTMASTHSRYNAVTCSAAAGTALATGVKTTNGVVGVDSLKERPLYSIAVRAKEAGMRVGIVTSVSLDHATPAAFYAHQTDRRRYYDIAADLPKAGFDFYAGSGFLKPQGGEGKPSVFELLQDSGYVVAKGMEELQALSFPDSKAVLLPREGASEALPYAIDAEDSDLSLEQITESAIRFLENGADEGFFLMVEGGKIDWSCHNNDAATTFREIIAFEKAVQKALDFYAKHSDETLIVVTADHETGGLSLGTGHYTLNLSVLGHQKASEEEITGRIKQLRKEKNNRVAWEDVREVLRENLGFWDAVALTGKQEEALRNVYKATFGSDSVEMRKSLYATNEPIVVEAIKILNDMAMVGWCSGGHSAGYVPVYAIGAGAGNFSGKLDNTDIPKKIEKAMHGHR